MSDENQEVSDAFIAYAYAVLEIEAAKNDKREWLNLGDDSLTELNLIPIEISKLTHLTELILDGTSVTDLAPLAELVNLRSLNLQYTLVKDLSPLVRMKVLEDLYLMNTAISDLGPLSSLTGLRFLDLENTHVSDLSPLTKLTALQHLNLMGSEVSDLRPIAGLNALGTDQEIGLAFLETPASRLDSRLAVLATIENDAERARETLAYLRSLPPYPQPYLPAATPDGSPPQWIGDMGLIDAQRLSDALPLAEDLIQNPETGAFDVRARPAVKPDLYAVNLEQVADAIEDVLRNPRNGLNAESPIIFRLKRTVTQYANDPQRVETDFTTQHASLTRQMAVGDLPPSDENLHLQTVLLQGAQGIRATHADIAVNRRIQQEQALRELTPKDIATIADAAPVLAVITEGNLQAQMAEDIAVLTTPLDRPLLRGVTHADSILGRDEAHRVFGRAARIAIALLISKLKAGIDKLHDSTGYKTVSILGTLASLIGLGLTILMM